MSIANALNTNFTDLGYNIVFRRQRTIDPTPFDDPRGLLRAGELPAKSMSYRIYVQTGEFVNTTNDIYSFIQGRSDVLIGKAQSRSAVLFFEGKDVVDLPTAALPISGNVITVPDRVFKFIHSGPTPFLAPGQLLSDRAAQETAKKSKDNSAIGVVVSSTAPADCAAANLSGFVNDPSSNQLIFDSSKGTPAFVTYVAVTKPLFRDVTYIETGFEGDGVAGLGALIVTNTGFIGGAGFFVVRYSWINTAAADQPAMFAWKMTESFNTQAIGNARVSNVQTLPPGLATSQADLQRAALDDAGSHFVYNVLESGDEIGTQFPNPPTKTAYPPLLAKAKMDSSSPYYDKSFRSAIVDYDPKSRGVPGGVTTQYSVGYDNLFRPTYGYDSPSLLFEASQNFRLGLEYSISQPNGISALGGPDIVILLEATKPAGSGLSAVYDCCLFSTYLFNSSSGNLVERTFDDSRWTKAHINPPPGLLKEFLLGEYPFRTDGKVSLMPPQIKLDAGISGTTIKLPANNLATSLVITVPPSDNAVFSLLTAASGTGKPLFEAAYPKPLAGSAQTQILTGIPNLKFGAYATTGGHTVEAVYGVDTTKNMLEAYTGDKNSSDPSTFQLAQVDVQKYPVQANNVTACGDCISGWLFVAFENQSRVDMAIRTTYSQTFSMVRDVTLRISEKFDTENKNKAAPKSSPSNVSAQGVVSTDPQLPPATLPFLLMDGDVKNEFLFYVYKSKLLVKRIPIEVFHSQPVPDDAHRYTVASEMAIAAKLGSLNAAMVYDGGGTGTSILVDLQKGAIKVTQSAAEVAAAAASKTPPDPVNQYSACIDQAGYLYAFIEAGPKIHVRRSSNMGDAWADCVPADFSFIPPIPGAKVDPTETRVDGQSPSVFHDPGTGTILMYFFMGQSLLFRKIPVEVLRGPVDKVAASLSAHPPRVLYGPLTSDMVKRGITAFNSVNIDSTTPQTVPPMLSPHRVAAAITSEGYYRVWFNDPNQVVRTLISFDTGDSWQTEDQIINKKKA